MMVKSDGQSFLLLRVRTSSAITVFRKTTIRKMATAVAMFTISVLLRLVFSATEILTMGKPKSV